MQALQRPARHGFFWLAQGFRLFRRFPGPLLGLVAGYIFLVLFAVSLPYVGALVASAIVPVISVGVMTGCRMAAEGRMPPVGVLFSGFRGDPRRTRTLLAMGILNLVLTLLALFASSLVDDGALLRLSMGQSVSAEEMMTPEFQRATQLAMLLMAPVLMAWWYAPLLTAWHDVPLVKALFFSFVACWRNWRPFLVYGLTGTALSLPLLTALLMVFGASPGALQALFPLALLLLAPPFFASFYVTYRDVFAPSAPSAPPPGEHVDTEA